MRYLAGLLLLLATYNISFAQAQVQDKKAVKYIRVTGHAEQYYEPTYVDIQINMAEKEKVNSSNYVAEREKDLLNILKEYNIDPSKLRVQQFNTGEAYSMFGSKYMVNKNYTLRIEDLTKYESVIVRLAEKDFKNLYVGEYGIADKNKRMEELMAEAVKNGTSKANIIAGAAGIKNMHILSVDETNERAPIIYEPYAAMRQEKFASAAADAVVNMPLGRIFLQKDVTMMYEIE